MNSRRDGWWEQMEWWMDWWVDSEARIARGDAGYEPYEVLAQVAILNEDGSLDVDTSFEFAALMAAAPRMRRLLVRTEASMAGFEEDDLQDEPIDKLLADIRRVIAATGGNE